MDIFGEIVYSREGTTLIQINKFTDIFHNRR